MLESKIQLPPSVVGWFDAPLGLAVILGIFFWVRAIPQEKLNDPLFCILLIGVLGLVMGSVEVARAPWRAIPRPHRRVSDIVGTTFIKLTGFFACLLLVAFAYWLFPEYDRSYYAKFFAAAYLIAPWLVAVSIPYFLYVEWRLPQERGGAWEMGQLLLGNVRNSDWNVLSQYLLGWLVKGFFLPIMFGDVVNAMSYLRSANWDLVAIGFVPSFNLLFTALINFELIFVSAGYIFTCRLFDSQIRAVEKTLFGWAIALMSYSPFLTIFYVRYLSYSSGSNWLDWLGGHPTLVMEWGSMILALLIIHMWSDACFGVRFSNLTNRGIITNGPYRFSKHPAYVIKSIRWWMVSVPFIAVNPVEGIRLSLLLLLVNLVYTIRAYAEERMLSQDPAYVRYALWMEEHGLLRFVGTYIPLLSYKKRLAYWREKRSPYIPADL